MIRIGASVMGVVLVVVGLALLIGWRLPAAHRVTREATFPVPAATLFALISRPADFPSWRRSVSRVELLPPEYGRERFREVGKNGAIVYRVDSATVDERLVTRIDDRTLPFGGTWTYELVPAGTGTTLRITEDGEVYSPLFRLMSRYVFGYTGTLDQYLEDVGRRVGRNP